MLWCKGLGWVFLWAVKWTFDLWTVKVDASWEPFVYLFFINLLSKSRLSLLVAFDFYLEILIEEEAYRPFPKCHPLRRPRHLRGLGLGLHSFPHLLSHLWWTDKHYSKCIPASVREIFGHIESGLDPSDSKSNRLHVWHLPVLFSFIQGRFL